MNNQDKENKKKIEKKIIIIVLIILLGICFIIKAITNFSRKDIDTYLKFKYHKNFETINTDSRQYVIPGLGCDGSYCIPEKVVEGKYEYKYTMYSPKDDITFKVYLIDDNGKKDYKDSYKFMKNIEDIINKTEKNFEKITSYKLDLELHEPTGYELNYSMSGTIRLEEKGIEIIDKEYLDMVETLNRKVKNKLDKEVLKYAGQVNFDYDININFSDNVTISLSENYNDTTIRLFLKNQHSKTVINLKELREYTSLKDFLDKSGYEYPYEESF